MIEDTLTSIRNILLDATNPVIFFDNDTDGTMSYFQLKTTNDNLKGFPFKKSKEEQIELAQLIQEKNDVVLFFDTPYIEEEVFEIIANKTIIWVDHHRGNDQGLIEKYNIYHFNPLNYDENDARPSCYWAYKIANTQQNLPLVSVGSVADFFLLEIIEELYNEDREYFNLLFDIEEKEELIDFINSTTYKDQQSKSVADWIMYLSFNTQTGVLKQFFDFIYKLDSSKIQSVVNKLSRQSLYQIIEEIKKGQEYPFDAFMEFREELQTHLNKALKQNSGKKIAYYSHIGEKSFNRQIIEECMYRLDEVEIMFSTFFKENSDIVSCSFRSKKIPVEPVLQETLSQFGGQGGGHSLACGAVISKKDFTKFKQMFMEKINQKIS